MNNLQNYIESMQPGPMQFTILLVVIILTPTTMVLGVMCIVWLCNKIVLLNIKKAILLHETKNIKVAVCQDTNSITLGVRIGVYGWSTSKNYIITFYFSFLIYHVDVCLIEDSGLNNNRINNIKAMTCKLLHYLP